MHTVEGTGGRALEEHHPPGYQAGELPAGGGGPQDH